MNIKGKKKVGIRGVLCSRGGIRNMDGCTVGEIKNITTGRSIEESEVMIGRKGEGGKKGK